MISRRPRVLALALALTSTIALTACTGEDETGATGSDESALTAPRAAGSDESRESDEGEESGGASASPGVSGGARLGGAGREAICGDALATDLDVATEDLLFPSESDYPFETIGLDDREGAGAITPARLLALLALDPQTRTETRAVDALFAGLVAEADGAKYQAVLDTLKSELTDLAVIRVLPPASSSAPIRVYVLGRTACAEIAGITTIAVET